MGHWPYYAHPDPKVLPIRWLLEVAELVLLAGIISVAAIPFGYGIYRAVTKWRTIDVQPHGMALGLYCVGTTLWIADIAAEFADLPWHSLAGWVLD